MASPQTENGYTKIANEILDALCKIRINGEARQVLDFIIRKTYGYGKKEDKISLAQFAIGTGLKRPTVCKAISKLKTLHLITQKGNDTINIYKFNKDFDTWKPLPKKIIVTQKDNNHYPKRKLPLPKKIHTKENITKDIYKENTGKPADSKKEKIKELVDIIVKDGFDMYLFLNKQENRVYMKPEIIEPVCNSYITSRGKIKSLWAWFSDRFRQEYAVYCSKNEVKSNVKDKSLLSIGDFVNISTKNRR